MHQDLIYDIGLHKGEDTEFYLRKGFSVIAVEADPGHVAYCGERLKEYISSGKLQIIPKAIVPSDAHGKYPETVTFYKADVSVCGTIMPDWAARDRMSGAKFVEIEVPASSFTEILNTYGTPYYLKIDIEGVDTECIECLNGRDELPCFISVEAEKEDAGVAERQLSALGALGYTRFQLTQQKGSHRDQRVPDPSREGVFVDWTFPSASSGLFGTELPEHAWVDIDQARRQLNRFRKSEAFWGVKGLQRSWLGQRVHGVVKRLLNDPLPGWYDLHAMHGSCNLDEGR